MSVCYFLASDCPLQSCSPPDAPFFLLPFPDVEDYTDKQHALLLEWDYTEEGARWLLDYIAEVLRSRESVELWHAWMLGWVEYEDRPVVHRQTLSLGELTPEDIRAFVGEPIWNVPDRRNPERPSFFCLTIVP